MSCFIKKLHTKILKNLHKIFFLYGYTVANCPLPFIVIFVLISGGLGIGLLRMEVSPDVHTPINSQMIKDKKTMQKYFVDTNTTNYIPHASVQNKRYADIILHGCRFGSFWMNDSMTEIKRIITRVNNITVSSDGFWTYEDICVKQNSTCIIDGSFISTNYFYEQSTEGNLTYPYWNHLHLGELDLRKYFGNVVVKNNTLVSAQMIRLHFNLQHYNSKRLSKKWEQKFIRQMKAYNSTECQVSFATSTSFNDELYKNAKDERLKLYLMFALVAICIICTSYGRNCIFFHAPLTVAGMLVAILSTLATLGGVSLYGVKLDSITGLLPFVILGTSLNNTFILLSGYALTAVYKPVGARVGKLFSVYGTAVTISSFASFSALGLGAISALPTVRSVCIFICCAAAVSYIGLMTLFGGCLTVCARQIAASFKHSEENNIVETIADIRSSEPSPSAKDNKTISKEFCRATLSPVIFYGPAKVLVLLLYMLYICFSTWGALHLKEGLSPEMGVPESSYLHTHSKLTKNFIKTLPISFVVNEPLPYWNNSTMGKITELLRVKKTQMLNPSRNISWLHAYAKSGLHNGTNRQVFISNLRTFVKCFPQYENDIVFDVDNTEIISSRFYVFTRNMKSDQDERQALREARKTADTSELPVFVYTVDLVHVEDDLTYLAGTLKVMGFMVSAIWVTAFVFLKNCRLSVVTVSSVLSILLGVLGFMNLWGLTLNPITMTYYFLSAGFAIQHSFYICLIYAQIEGIKRSHRLADTILRCSEPIMKGSLAAALGLLMLFMSNSYIFASFFKVMMLVILFGLLHSSLFLPTLLSILGPHSKKAENKIEINFQKQIKENKTGAVLNPSPRQIQNHINAIVEKGKRGHPGSSPVLQSEKETAQISIPITQTKPENGPTINHPKLKHPDKQNRIGEDNIIKNSTVMQTGPGISPLTKHEQKEADELKNNQSTTDGNVAQTLETAPVKDLEGKANGRQLTGDTNVLNTHL